MVVVVELVAVTVLLEVGTDTDVVGTSVDAAGELGAAVEIGASEVLVVVTSAGVHGTVVVTAGAR